jgi:hydrogenase maturation protein HypF
MTVPAADTRVPPAVRKRLRIVVRGAVQGVGFRPFVHRQAVTGGLAGWVRNCSEGVTVEAEGEAGALSVLVDAMRYVPPPNAKVNRLEVSEIAPAGETSFVIRPSEATGSPTAEVLPDLATCADCLAELFDPADRRHRYPFINCTQCGPRYSIIEAMPYDRCRTTMRHFRMCPSCQAEYQGPTNRRFHAEPNACPVCGPRLALWDGDGRMLARDDAALLKAADALRQGQIVALKGIGGFHLLVDARDEGAVRRLRARKRREEKPFAVMFPSLADANANCRVGPQEEALLTGSERPIVLLQRTGDTLAPALAPCNPRLGVLLPYAPVHHLLMRELGFPVVATSGNVTDEPIVTDEAEALSRLLGIADLFLVHDRPIVRPIDDSVVRTVCGRELMLRRARGYAPAPIAVDGMPGGILALGGHLKTTVALTRADGVVVSQHIGDLETAAARKAHRRTIADMERLHVVRPRLAACDLHPDYCASWLAETWDLPVIAVQHHVAHVAACMAEHRLAPPVLGVAWDGTGYGPDGTIWGGEFLLVTASGWRRVGHLRRFCLPGGEAAMREPRRADLPPVAAFSAAERTVASGMIGRGINAPVTSSAGRLFDAFAALGGLRQRASYEGQAAAELEWAAEGQPYLPGYEFPIREPSDSRDPSIVDWQEALAAAIADWRAGATAPAISAAFHRGLARAIAKMAVRIGEQRVILTGGCFQNAHLTESVVAAVQDVGCEPIWHQRMPPNDGSLALGQAAWAAWGEQRRHQSCA